MRAYHERVDLARDVGRVHALEVREQRDLLTRAQQLQQGVHLPQPPGGWREIASMR
jgi:hypothetical protein